MGAVQRLELLSYSQQNGLEIDALDAEMILAMSGDYDDQFVALGRLERAPGKNDNWIESVGKLPAYIEDVANSLHEKRGMTISRAIATAISQIKKWIASPNTKPDTKAKAVKAIAEWEALRAKAAAKRAAS
jgi:hypothetical protein